MGASAGQTAVAQNATNNGAGFGALSPANMTGGRTPPAGLAPIDPTRLASMTNTGGNPTPSIYQGPMGSNAVSGPISAAPAATASAPQFNVNTAASNALQSSMANTAKGQYFNSAQQAGQYMNPYVQNVIGGLGRNAMTNYQKQANQLGAEATAAGAFGGSRHGVAQGTMAAGVQNDLNNQIGNLMYQGYNNALGQASSDQQMRMGAANQLANLSNLGFGMGQTINQNLAQQGAMQQALQQMAMDKASQQYAGYTQSPYTALSAYTAALGSTPYPQTTTSTQNTKRGLFDYLALGGSIYSGL